MRAYQLYLESGPQKRTTLVHVLELLGCVANGPTTDEALAATHDAIRAYVTYLRRHGEKADPAARFTTRVAEHVTEGDFLGHGSSTIVFAPEREPLDNTTFERLLRWLAWSREDLLALVCGLDRRRLDAAADGRTIRKILEHVLEAERAYVYKALGQVKPVADPANAVRRGAMVVLDALPQQRAAAIAHLSSLTREQREAVPQRGKETRTVRRSIRRMLEHEWEHRREIARRLGREA